MSDEISKEMKRYYQNRERYNARAKTYFNNIYYPNKKEEIKERSREYRLNRRPPKKKISQSYTADNNLIVCFD
jgi:hypothetical protein